MHVKIHTIFNFKVHLHFWFQRLLAKLFDMTKRQSGLLQDALVLLHTDIAMVREGFDCMMSNNDSIYVSEVIS